MLRQPELIRGQKKSERERERVGVPIYVRTRERVYIGKEERESVCI